LGAEGERLERQAELLRGLRAGTLEAFETYELARLTEDLGDLPTALRIWDVIERRHASEIVHNESSAPDWTYAELAAFWTRRIRHKMTLPDYQMIPDAELLRRLGHHARTSAQTSSLNGRGGLVDLSVQTDLDGDGIDEVFMVGKYGPLDRRDEPFMCVAKWNGSEYRVVWRANAGDRRMRLFPSMFEVCDRNGDGLKEIQVGFEANTDNAASLYFNGETAILANW
jgi:hypothetical protein